MFKLVDWGAEGSVRLDVCSGWRHDMQMVDAILVGFTIRLRQVECGLAEDGQDVVEYALLCGLLTLVTLTAIIALGPVILQSFSDMVNALSTAVQHA